jgi:hypothetical protein
MVLVEKSYSLLSLFFSDTFAKDGLNISVQLLLSLPPLLLILLPKMYQMESYTPI